MSDDDIEEFDLEGGAGHDQDTCPNCMKWGMLGILDYMAEMIMATGLLVEHGGVYTFTPEEWESNIKTMREFTSMLESAVETVYAGTPFPWDKYAAEEEEDA